MCSCRLSRCLDNYVYCGHITTQGYGVYIDWMLGEAGAV